MILEPELYILFLLTFLLWIQHVAKFICQYQYRTLEASIRDITPSNLPNLTEIQSKQVYDSIICHALYFQKS